VFRRCLVVAFSITSVVAALTIFPACAQDSPPALKTPPGFDLAAEMIALYGNYDPSTGIAGVTLPPGETLDEKAAVDVHPLFVASVPDTGNTEVFLVTFAVPSDDDFSCHVCTPLLGVSLFKKSVSGWTVEASQQLKIGGGVDGNPPQAELFQFGPQHFGIKLKLDSSAQGEEATDVSFLVPWAGSFSNSLNVRIENDNLEGCGPQSYRQSLCFSFHKTIKFVAGDDPEYYDVIIETSGTHLAQTNLGYFVEDISGTVRTPFDQGSYVSKEERKRQALRHPQRLPQ
jgi:hypothetical protein